MSTETDTEHETLDAFIARHKIAAIARQRRKRPGKAEMERWGGGSRHWQVRLSADGDPYPETIWFSQGSAHTQEPTAAAVLDCLASDASAYENARDFGDFAAEIGYDEDSRKAERIYTECGKTLENLRTWLGDDEADRLMFGTERL